MKTTQRRAQPGGEVGANGEFYEGGKFIATTDHAKSHKPTKRGTGRQQYEPYKWEVPPEGMISIYQQLAGYELYNRQTNVFTFNPSLASYLAEPDVIVRRKARIAAYNAGERWTKGAYQP